MKDKIINNRNYGIDILRVISMLFVIVLHSLGHGGILKTAIVNSPQYKVAWIMEIIAYCAVDIFAIISGYVAYTDKEKDVKYSNYIKLWLEVVFYGLLINIIFNLININFVHITDYIKVLFPVSYELYWYFTAYTGLFILMPIINKGIRNLDNNMLKKVFVIIFVFFSLLGVVFENFELYRGYSFIWITLLYILGMIMKKCNIGSNLSKSKIIIGIVLLYLTTYLYRIYGFDYKALNIEITKSLFVSYISPTMVGVSILYVLLFSKFKFNEKINNVIAFLASSSFAIYIINEHKLVKKLIMTNLFVGIANDSIFKIIFYVIGFSIIFVILSILIDKFRIFIFKICKINELSEKIVNYINKCLNKVVGED